MRVTLPRFVRRFRREGNTLIDTGVYLTRGAQIDVRQAEWLVADNQEKWATPFTLSNETYYLVIDEIGITGLLIQLVNYEETVLK